MDKDILCLDSWEGIHLVQPQLGTAQEGSEEKAAGPLPSIPLHLTHGLLFCARHQTPAHRKLPRLMRF